MEEILNCKVCGTKPKYRRLWEAMPGEYYCKPCERRYRRERQRAEAKAEVDQWNAKNKPTAEEKTGEGQ